MCTLMATLTRCPSATQPGPQLCEPQLGFGGRNAMPHACSRTLHGTVTAQHTSLQQLQHPLCLVCRQAAATLEHLLRQELKDQQEAIADLRCAAATYRCLQQNC